MYFNDQNTQFPLLQTEPRKLYYPTYAGTQTMFTFIQIFAIISFVTFPLEF